MAHPGGSLNALPASTRTAALRDELLVTVDLLQRRRADLISEKLISDYIALNWLEWNGGTLRLTETGKNTCQQLRAVRE